MSSSEGVWNMFSHPQGSKASVRSHHILYILAHCIPVKYIKSPLILPFIGGVAIHSSTSFTNPKKQKDMTQGGAPLKVFQLNLTGNGKRLPFWTAMNLQRWGNGGLMVIFIWLVVWNHGILWFSIQLGILFPTDELIFFREVGMPPTRQKLDFPPCVFLTTWGCEWHARRWAQPIHGIRAWGGSRSRREGHLHGIATSAFGSAADPIGARKVACEIAVNAEADSSGGGFGKESRMGGIARKVIRTITHGTANQRCPVHTICNAYESASPWADQEGDRHFVSEAQRFDWSMVFIWPIENHCLVFSFFPEPAIRKTLHEFGVRTDEKNCVGWEMCDQRIGLEDAIVDEFSR